MEKGRSMKKRKSMKKGVKYKICKDFFWYAFCVCFLCTFIFSGTVTSVLAEESELKEGELYAASAVLMDADSGRILFEKDGYAAMANASTTKILTCIVTLEKCDLESVVTVSANAAKAPKVHLGMREGQQFYLKDLLYGLMLESFNDCAVAIAEHVAGSTEHFADILNDKAKEIGCSDTYFITPNGLDATDENSFHHTTAADLALMMRYCIKESPMAERFLEITRASSYNFTDLSGNSSYSCTNKNAFLQMMDGALTGKTGFTGKAGYCYVGALERDGKTYIVSLLACGWPNNKTYKWSDSKKLFSYGLDTYELHSTNEITAKEQISGRLPVLNGQTEQMQEVAYVETALQVRKETPSVLMTNTENWEIEVECVECLEAPVAAGMKIGFVNYYLDGELYYSADICITESVKKIDVEWCFQKVLERFLF